MYQVRVMLPNASCNLNCKYCINTNNIRGLDVDVDFAKLFTKMDLVRFGSIGIWGGEPLFNPNFEKIVRALRRKYPDKLITTTSNGVLMNERWVELLNELDVYYSISHDGKGQGLRCKDFLQDEKYIALLKKLKHFGGFNAVISRTNCDLVGNYEYLLQKCGDIPGSWQISFGLFELFEEEILDFMPSVEEYSRLKEGYKEIARLACAGAAHLEGYARRRRQRRNAPTVWRCNCATRLTLDTQGNVYQCQVAADRRDNTLPKPSLPLMCANCIHADYCRGICPLIPDRLRKKLCMCHHLYYDALLELDGEEKTGGMKSE